MAENMNQSQSKLNGMSAFCKGSLLFNSGKTGDIQQIVYDMNAEYLALGCGKNGSDKGDADAVSRRLAASPR